MMFVHPAADAAIP